MNSALIVIDVQESFRQRPIWEAVSNPGIVGKVNRLVAAARERGDLVVWVLHSEPGTGGVFDTPSGYVRLMDGLEPAAGEPVITKTSRNAFTTTNLQQLLTTRGIGELVISGIQTEQCCETTTRLAADLGFEVTFVIDATATFPIAHRDARGTARSPSCSPTRRPCPPPTSWPAPSTPWPAASPPSPPLTSWSRPWWGADRIVPQVVFLLVPRLHLLDLAGPAQVFSTAADQGLGYRLRYVAEQEDVPTAQGLPLRASVDWPELTAEDLLVVPGWRAPMLHGSGLIADATLSRLAAHHAGAARWPASAPVPRRSAGPACSTDAAAPPTTTSRTSSPGATRRPAWCPTCSTSRTTGW